MISFVLCLLEVLHFILSLSRENLFMEWAATMASLQNESNCWVYRKLPLVSVSGLPWKMDLGNATMWGQLTIFLSWSMPLCQKGTCQETVAKSLQSCLTPSDPIDSSPPGSPVPGILQARTLEWVAISFSNAWKWKGKVKSLSHVRLLATPWTAAYQAPLSMGFARQEYWNWLPLPSPSKQYCITTLHVARITAHFPLKPGPPSAYSMGVALGLRKPEVVFPYN